MRFFSSSIEVSKGPCLLLHWSMNARAASRCSCELPGWFRTAMAACQPRSSCKHHPVVLGRLQGEAVTAGTKVHSGIQLLRLFATEVQQGIRPSGQANCHLELLIQNLMAQAEKTDEVGFAGAVGANQHIASAQFQVAFGNGLVATQHKPRDLPRVGCVVGLRAHWSTFAFGCGMSAFGRPCGADVDAMQARPQSTCAPDTLTTCAHLRCSSAMCLANSAGLLPPGMAPWASRRSLSAGVASDRATSCWMRWMISGAVPTGASRPNHELAS